MYYMLAIHFRCAIGCNETEGLYTCVTVPIYKWCDITIIVWIWRRGIQTYQIYIITQSCILHVMFNISICYGI